MNLDIRKNAFISLGEQIMAYINGKSTTHKALFDVDIQQACVNNLWFTPHNIHQALTAIASDMLQADKLNNWLAHYPQLASHARQPRTVGIIMAGNIPLVGFHDLLCVLLCGHRAKIKPSSKDTVLLKALIEILYQIEPRFANYITLVNEHPQGVDAVITTGSNNTARYFESWYGNIPHIIRKNRSSIAVLTGTETTDELKQLGADVFAYFGLGCRNVSTLFVPEGYDFQKLTNAFASYATILEHKSYSDCYRYQKAVAILEGVSFIDTGFLLIRNSLSLSAPVALVNCQKYATLDFVKEQLNAHRNSLQCVVYQYNDVSNAVKMGQTQHPQLHDYADGIDTMDFLLKLM